MIGQIQTLNRSLFTRQCVACGYDGALLRGGRASRCARCGCDLRLRPARSYAEMEGLLEPSCSSPPPPCVLVSHHRRVFRRWAVFLTAAIFGMIAFAWLAASAFAF